MEGTQGQRTSPESPSHLRAQAKVDKGLTEAGGGARASLSPGQRLAQCRVEDSTTHLLLGDSIICPMKAHLMFPEKTCQNLGVPGLSVKDIVHWLENKPKFSQVKVIVCHIGINSCNVSCITVRQWQSLHKLMKRVFPEAEILCSTIVPTKGDHPLRKTVDVSNEALKQAAEGTDITVISNDSVFRAPSGAPRKALYRDRIHPNPLGTGRLACNIKNRGRPPVHRAHQETVKFGVDHRRVREHPQYRDEPSVDGVNVTAPPKRLINGGSSERNEHTPWPSRVEDGPAVPQETRPLLTAFAPHTQPSPREWFSGWREPRGLSLAREQLPPYRRPGIQYGWPTEQAFNGSPPFGQGRPREPLLGSPPIVPHHGMHQNYPVHPGYGWMPNHERWMYAPPPMQSPLESYV